MLEGAKSIDTTLASGTVEISTSTVPELEKNKLVSSQRRDFNKIAVVQRKDFRRSRKNIAEIRENRVKPKPEESVTYLRSEISLLGMGLFAAAYFHMRERLDVFGRLLGIMAILSSSKSFPEHSAFQVTAAKWQIQHGSKERGSQAAHLALMVRVGGFELTEYVKDAMAVESIKHLHTHTHEVPTEVNEVDSWLEKVLLRKAIQAIGSRYMQQCTGDLKLSHLENLLRTDYVLLAKEARGEIENKLVKVNSKRQRSNDPMEIIKLEKKLEILDAYWKAFDPMLLPESIGQTSLRQLSLIFGDDLKEEELL